MKKIYFMIIIFMIILLSILLIMKTNIKSETTVANNENNIEENIIEEKKEERKVQIFNGNSRPIAVMIDNVGDALPQAGLNKAYIVYEIIVEGSQTRLMALFKDKNLEKIGPIRSSRHYFLDYALENDAIYVHYGWSPKAQTDISTLKVQNINGITESASSFWRVKDKSAPHNVVTSIDKILQIAQRKGYSTTSTKETILNYVTDEVNLENGILANSVNIPYSTSYKVKYDYDMESKTYVRSYNNKIHKDWVTEEKITAKNIIITFANNFNLNDEENKGRQDLENVGTLDGYYITNGQAIKIKCEKKSRKEQTIYKDLDGNEIKVNDGNTFIQIVPINANVVVE